MFLRTGGLVSSRKLYHVKGVGTQRSTGTLSNRLLAVVSLVEFLAQGNNSSNCVTNLVRNLLVAGGQWSNHTAFLLTQHMHTVHRHTLTHRHIHTHTHTPAHTEQSARHEAHKHAHILTHKSLSQGAKLHAKLVTTLYDWPCALYYNNNDTTHMFCY